MLHMKLESAFDLKKKKEKKQKQNAKSKTDDLVYPF